MITATNEPELLKQKTWVGRRSSFANFTVSLSMNCKNGELTKQNTSQHFFHYHFQWKRDNWIGKTILINYNSHSLVKFLWSILHHWSITATYFIDFRGIPCQVGQKRDNNVILTKFWNYGAFNNRTKGSNLQREEQWF